MVDRQLKLDVDAGGPNEGVHARFTVVVVPLLDCGDVDDPQYLEHNPITTAFNVDPLTL